MTSPNGERTIIGIAIVQSGDRFLVGTRNENQVLGGLSEFPGGKCEPGEAPSDCAIRECLEETGLKVQLTRQLAERCHDYAHGHLELHFFLCQPYANQPVPAGSFVWVQRSELAGLKFPDANADVVQALLDA